MSNFFSFKFQKKTITNEFTYMFFHILAFKNFILSNYSLNESQTKRNKDWIKSSVMNSQLDDWIRTNGLERKTLVEVLHHAEERKVRPRSY